MVTCLKFQGHLINFALRRNAVRGMTYPFYAQEKLDVYVSNKMQGSQMKYCPIPLIAVEYVVKQLLQLNTKKARRVDNIIFYFLK